jgi:peptidoglycan/LPS O-acetylase OafA/YrhL
VAVLAVVAFHIPWLKGRFSGGYVGVDVFFVISGYLISAIMFSNIENKTFSIAWFYERRVRRIFPALMFMLAVVSLACYRYLFPSELEGYAASLLSATLSGSNFYFWHLAGYFDAPLSHPLLHTWSLAVEEQFYLVFPLFLTLARRFSPRHLRAWVLLLAAVSFGISAVEAYRNPNSAFYMPYTRAWEMLLGTILSMGMLPQMRSAAARNLATVAGLAAIVVSVAWYAETTPFPGIAALLPCGGAALIIWAGEAGSSVVGRLLSLRPVVFVGLISYSLYLWHWPLIVFQSMGLIPGNQLAKYPSIAVVFGLSVAVATLSWAFVERPFRKGRMRLSGRPLFGLAAAASAAFIVFGLVTLRSGGFRHRFPPEAVELASYTGKTDNLANQREGTCFITNRSKFSDFDTGTCLRESSTAKNYLLLGDSHAAMLWYPLSQARPDANIMQASLSGCRPYLTGSSGDCLRMMNFMFHDWLVHHSIDGLIAAGRWQDGDIPKIAALVAWANSRHIPLTLIGPTPEYDAPLPRLLAYSIITRDPDYAYEHRIKRMADLDAKLRALAKDTWHVHYISLIQASCEADACMEYSDAQKRLPLMFDTNHFSDDGSALVMSILRASGQLNFGDCAATETAAPADPALSGNCVANEAVVAAIRNEIMTEKARP